MNTKTIITLFVLLIPIVASAKRIKSLNDIEKYVKAPNTTYIISRPIDLHSCKITIPYNCTLKLTKKGRLSNGSIIGNHTKLEYIGSIFEDINIEGSWNVSDIHSYMYDNIDSNGLQSLLKLQNDSIQNRVFLEFDSLDVNINDGKRSVIQVSSNTELIINGIIKLSPQDSPRLQNGYYIIDVRNKHNVTIKGNGAIIGDRLSSPLKTEYGHGICVWGSDNTNIQDLLISNTNGDGIAVSLGNKSIYIDNVTISGYHRNGVSVVDCKNFQMTNTSIQNGGTTNPYAGIDFEPNKGCSIDSASIKNILFSNCTVGISGFTNSASVNYVECSDINIRQSSRCPISISGIQTLVLRNVDIDDIIEGSDKIIQILSCDSVQMSQLHINADNNSLKYPLYISNSRMSASDCRFNSPQLFSYHLQNASFRNCEFKFKSLVWTASNRTTSDVHFFDCRFEGPIELYPKDVKFERCVFDVSKTNCKKPISFLKSSSLKSTDKGVELMNCSIVSSPEEDVQINNNVPNSKVEHMHILHKDTPYRKK